MLDFWSLRQGCGSEVEGRRRPVQLEVEVDRALVDDTVILVSVAYFDCKYSSQRHGSSLDQTLSE